MKKIINTRYNQTVHGFRFGARGVDTPPPRPEQEPVRNQDQQNQKEVKPEPIWNWE